MAKLSSKSKFFKQNRRALVKACKALLSLLKPMLTALAFLLVSSLAQHWVQHTPAVSPCTAQFGTAVISAVSEAKYPLENKQVMAGVRTLVVTRHAAQRMVERGVNLRQVEQALETGQLFAYAHNGLIKIGYYHKASKIFLAVDKQHRKIITAIVRVPTDYIFRLLFTHHV